MRLFRQSNQAIPILCGLVSGALPSRLPGLASSLFSRSIALFFLIALATNVMSENSPNSLVLDTEWYNLGANVDYLEDKNSEYSFQQIIEGPLSNRFTRSEQTLFNIGYTSSTYWIRFPLRIKADADKKLIRYLEIDHRVLSEISIYQISRGREFELDLTRSKHITEPSAESFSSYLFPLEIETNIEHLFFVKVRSYSSIRVPIYLWDPKNFMIQKTTERIFYGILYGIMFGLSLYNIFIYFSVKQQSYLYYSLYVLTMLVMISTINGIAFQYLWENFAWFSSRAPIIIGAFQNYFMIQFTRRFLRTEQNCGIEDKVLRAVSFASILLLLLFFNDETSRLLAGFYSLLALIYIPICWVAGVHCYKKKVKEARFYLLGWSFLVVTMLVFIASIYGIVPINFYTQHAIEFGLICEVLLFSFALADRINVMSEEKHQLQIEKLELSHQSHRLKDEFLATISHEFRTPMNGVMGGLQMVNRLELPKELGRYLDLVSDSAHKMINIVDNMLMFSELQSGSVRLNLTPFIHEDLIKNISSTFNEQCCTRNLQFKLELCGNKDELMIGDISKIEQVLFQVFDNAIKFTSQGEITFSVSLLDSLQEGRRGYRYSISDTGIGIEENMEGVVFEYFSQIDASSTRSHGGLGIGLAISKALIKLSGGNIGYKSNEAEGTTFVVENYYDILSSPEEIESYHNVKYPSTDKPRDKIKILIVEDNKVNQMTINSMLKKMGYQTVVADNGKIGVEMAEREEPDLILMDCQMPVMDGYEATKSIREGASSINKIPIIAVTANTTSEDRSKCYEAGMDDFLKKPVNKKELDQHICQCLSKRVSH